MPVTVTSGHERLVLDLKDTFNIQNCYFDMNLTVTTQWIHLIDYMKLSKM